VAFWKNIDMLRMANIMRGIKIVAHAFPGYLYTGIIKWEYWKYYIFPSFGLVFGNSGGWNGARYLGVILYVLLLMLS
jgi:hypothetical protein